MNRISSSWSSITRSCANVHELLALESDFEVIEDGVDGPQAVASAKKLRPDVVLMDIAMPCSTASKPLVRCSSRPLASKVVILSAHSEAAYKRPPALFRPCDEVAEEGGDQLENSAIFQLAQLRSYTLQGLLHEIHFTLEEFPLGKQQFAPVLEADGWGRLVESGHLAAPGIRVGRLLQPPSYISVR